MPRRVPMAGYAYAYAYACAYACAYGWLCLCLMRIDCIGDQNAQIHACDGPVCQLSIGDCQLPIGFSNVNREFISYAAAWLPEIKK